MRYLNVPMSEELMKALDDYSKENGLFIKKIVELALIAYLKKKQKYVLNVAFVKKRYRHNK